MTALQFVETTHQCGGNVAQLYKTMTDGLSDDALKRVREKAEALDIVLEIHGGVARSSKFDAVLKTAAALGCQVVGCNFGFLMRPNKISTLKAWEEYKQLCQSRLSELARLAKSLGLKIAVENHAVFTIEELHDLVTRANSDHVGILLDTGNMVATLDDPIEAIALLGPHILSTHCKDFAVEETDLGFRFTMVPFGRGSLRLEDINEALLKHTRPEVNFCVEMINGQHFDVNWLEDRFWTAYRGKSPRQIAATLRHIRSNPFDPEACTPIEELDKLPYRDRVALESDRTAQCIAHLRAL